MLVPGEYDCSLFKKKYAHVLKADKSVSHSIKNEILRK